MIDINNNRVPDDFIEFGDVIMSNVDHKIHYDIAEKVKNNKFYSAYPGWNFYGKLWWHDNKWNCEIMCYLCYTITLSSESLEEIMNEACKLYGEA